MSNSIYYEVVCTNCKKMFKIYEGTPKYRELKKNRNGNHICEQCEHNIRHEAIRKFMNQSGYWQ